MSTNTFITPTHVAREAALALENELVMGNLVHRDIGGQDQIPKGKGDTISVRIPPTLTAEVFTSSATAVNVTETKVDVALDTILSVSQEITAKDLSLSVDDFNAIVVVPSCKALARGIDQYLCDLVKDIPYTETITATAVVGDVALLNKRLNINKCPQEDRRLVLDPIAHSRFITMDAFLHAEKMGNQDAIRNASLGRVLGLDTYMSQQVNKLTIGDWHKTNTLLTAAAGATTGTYAAAGTAGNLVVGEVFTVTGVAGQYVVTAQTNHPSDGSGTVAFYPAMATIASGAAITKVGTTAATLGYTAGEEVNSMAFHKNAFCLAMRPLEKPLGGAASEVINYNGISIRVTYDYTMSTKMNLISFDVLFGVKTLCKELACRFMNI